MTVKMNVLFADSFYNFLTSHITKVFYTRIVPIPNVTITELGITELFYYGLLLPNVAHSQNLENEVRQQ